MSVIRLYFDADAMRRTVVQGVRARGIDAKTANESGLAGASDEEQLKFACQEGRVLYSFNISDFQRIHTDYLSHGQTHAGIILAPQQAYSIGEQIRRLLHLISARSAEEMRDRLEFLSGWN